MFHPPQPGKTPQTESLQLHELNLIHSRLWQIALPDEHRRELARGAGFCGLSTTASIVPVSQQNGPCPAAIRNNFARTHARMYAHHASDAPSSLARSAASSASARVCNRSLCRSLCARNSWQYSQGQRHVARLFEPRCANRRRVSSPLKVYLTSSGACESSSAAAAVLQSAPKIFVYKCHLYTNVICIQMYTNQTNTHPPTHMSCACAVVCIASCLSARAHLLHAMARHDAIPPPPALSAVAGLLRLRALGFWYRQLMQLIWTELPQHGRRHRS